MYLSVYCTVSTQLVFIHTMSWWAGGKAIKAEARLSLSLFAASEGYYDSAHDNVGVHHQGSNFNVKTRIVESQDTRDM